MPISASALFYAVKQMSTILIKNTKMLLCIDLN